MQRTNTSRALILGLIVAWVFSLVVYAVVKAIGAEPRASQYLSTVTATTGGFVVLLRIQRMPSQSSEQEGRPLKWTVLAWVLIEAWITLFLLVWN
jgi:zinc transporter ZupT